MPQHYFRLTEASTILRVSVDSLRAYERKGVVTYARIGGQRMLTERDFKAIRMHRSQFGRKRQQPLPSEVVASE
jgi:DNA-binding transcriptional MerR regulator